MNTKFLFQILTIFLGINVLWSCHNAKNLEAYTSSTVPDRLDSTLLWKLEGKGIKKPSYIYGTIHMIGEKDFIITADTKNALDQTKKLVMEIDMSQMMASSMKLLSMAPMQKGTKLKDLISSEEYKLVKDFFTHEAESPELKLLPFETIENWKPMLLQSFLYHDMIEGPVKAYEIEFLSMGNNRKMEFGGLETVEDQISVFEKIPYKAQAKELVEMIEDIKKGKNTGKNEFEKLIEIYKLQDIEGMVEMSQEEFGQMDDSEEALLIDRNKKWIPKMIKMAKDQPTFFAVGAAHLGGTNGVIRLLLKEGCELTPVK